MKKILYILIILPFIGYTQNYEGLDYACWVINQNFSTDTYKVNAKIKSKVLTKFGENNDLGATKEIIWAQGGLEVYPTGNTIDSMSSSSAADNQIVRIEGHTISNDTITFVAFTDTLNGQTPVVLNTPLYRLNRMFNNDDTDFAGTIYGYSGGAVTAGVPQVADSIHITIPMGTNQSQKCATTLSSRDYYIITSLIIGIGDTGGAARTVDFNLEIRNYGKVFRQVYTITTSNGAGPTEVIFDPPFIIDAGSDVRVTGVSSGAATQVSADINGYLATDINFYE